MENLPTCEDCICHITLYKHPWNKGELKGSISEPTGLYACIVEHEIDKDRKGIISDRIGNGCELHVSKAASPISERAGKK